MRREIWVGLVMSTVSSTVVADHRLEYVEGEAGVNILEVGSQSVRMQRAGDTQWMLYRDTQRRFYLVDDSRKSYQQMDESTGKALQQQLSAIQQQMEAQLAAMPPEQREMMRQMMPKLPGAASGSQYRVEETGDPREVAGYACQPVTVYKDDKADEALCLAQPKALGVAAEDFAVLKRMGELMSEVAASFGAGSMAAVLKAMEALPVEHRKPGAAKPSARLQSSESGAIAADRFAIPEGYQQRALIPGGPQ